MNLQSALKLADGLAEGFEVDVEVYPEYAGKQLPFGKTTAAVAIPPDAVMLAGFVAGYLGLDAEELPTRQDPFGRDLMVY